MLRRKLLSSAAWFFRCTIGGKSREVLEQCPEHEQQTATREGIHLFLTAATSGLLWGVFGAKFVSWWSAPALGIIGFCLILLLDQAIGAAEWVLTGMLADPASPTVRHKIFKFAMRTLVAMVFGIMTSIGASMVLYDDSIQQQINQIVWKINQQRNGDAAERVHSLMLQRFGPLQTRFDDLDASIKRDEQALGVAKATLAGAASRRTSSAAEQGKELSGANGRPRGAGDYWRKAGDDAKAAAAEAATAKANISTIEPRLAVAKSQLPAVEKQLLASRQSLRSEMDQIEAERIAAQVKPGHDPLMAVTALRQVFEDPLTGADARDFSCLMLLFLTTTEISYVMVKIFLTPPSIYILLLIKMTRERAEKELDDYEGSHGDD